MDKITIVIDKMGGSAFEVEKTFEVARILREIADLIEDGRQPRKAIDLNGNSVGYVVIE